MTSDSSTLEWPSITAPSTGTLSPGRTRRRSPFSTRSRDTSSSEPSGLRRSAVAGASLSSALIAPPVFSRARNCSTSPSSTRTEITADASKYKPTAPCMSRNSGGNHPGASSATTLYEKATPVPIAISVYMLRLRDTSDCQPRTKNGHAAHSTTGVENRNCIHADVAGATSACSESPGTCSPMARTNTGKVSTSPIQKRLVMSMSSTFGPSSPVVTSGSSAMPHFGQGPGPTWRTSGCMGQVKMASAATGTLGLFDLTGIAWGTNARAGLFAYFAGSVRNVSRQPEQQK